RSPPGCTLFPYTTLFRSCVRDEENGLPADGDIALDQRRAVAGGGLPVDIADLVAGHVGTQVVKIQAAAPKNGTVFAVEHSTGFRSEEHTSELQSLAYLVC